MFIYGNFNNAMVMTKKKNESKKEAGRFFYSVGVVANNELGEISCSEEVYNQTEIGKTYDFATTYRTDYQMFSLSSITGVHKGSVFDTNPNDKK